MSLSMLSNVTQCPACQANVTLVEVYRVADLDGRFVVMFFRCRDCKASDKVAVNRKLYEELKGEFTAGKKKIEDAVFVMALDLEVIDGVDDFLMYCGSLGVPLESPGRCQCPRCANRGI